MCPMSVCLIVCYCRLCFKERDEEVRIEVLSPTAIEAIEAETGIEG